MEEVTILVKPSFNPGDTAFLTHPQLLAHQPDEAFIMGYQDYTTLKDRTDVLKGTGSKGYGALGKNTQARTCSP